jgi:thiosulfate/3-mercaptopyruvate sulfurtransferase
MAELTETLPGVWFWEEPHADWAPGDSWDETVRSWALRTPAGLVLVDPLVRDDLHGAAAWAPLDALAEAHGPVVGVIRLLHFHHRSAAQASAHFDVPIYARPLPHDGIPVHPFDDPTRNGGELLGGLVAHHVHRDDEIVLWVPQARALLFADVGQRRDGRFELCPEHWLHAPDSWFELRTDLSALAHVRHPEHLLVSHGVHRLGDGAELLAADRRAEKRPLPPFIDLEDIDTRREHWKLLDARLYLDGRSEREGCEARHLPGAQFLDFRATLSDDPGPDAPHGRHPLPSPERFAAGLRAAGIDNGDTVVAYDDSDGVMAARLVWLLRSVGVDAALLAPVPDHWEAAPVEPAQPGNFSPRPWPAERFVDIDEVANRPAGTVLLDARDPARFAGDGPDPVDPRSGHIPGAVNLPCRANVGPGGALIRWDDLVTNLRAAIGDSEDVISSCGSGVTACHTLLTLEAVGIHGRLYVGSFSEWSRDPAREVATGAAPRRDPANR